MNWKDKYDKDELLKEGLITNEEYKAWDKDKKRKAQNAAKRELRQAIADMCGTSYAAACRDMGLSRQ